MHHGTNDTRPIHFAASPDADDCPPRELAPVLDIHDWNPAHATSTALDELGESPESHPDDIVYEIDASGRLIRVSLAWNRFALSNGAPDLRAENVVGRAFWDFFDGSDGLVDEHRSMLDRCRERRQRGSFLIRCDAPGQRRMLRMWIEPIEHGRFRFTSRTLAIETLDPRIYDRILRVADPVRVARCSHCNRFRVEEEWFEPEDAVRQDWERERPGRRRSMVHTLCPGCRQHLRAIPRLVSPN